MKKTFTFLIILAVVGTFACQQKQEQKQQDEFSARRANQDLPDSS